MIRDVVISVMNAGNECPLKKKLSIFLLFFLTEHNEKLTIVTIPKYLPFF